METTSFEQPRALRASPAGRSFDAERAIAALHQEALAHPAVAHPYLAALASGELPAPAAAVLDFAYQYYGYSSWFQRYLTGVIGQLEEPGPRQALIHKLAAESGALDEDERCALERAGIPVAWVDGVPHPRLYERFLAATGMDAALRAGEPLGDDVRVWRQQLLHTCSHAGARVAVGALGLGTELIVGRVYRPVMTALARSFPLSPRDRVFFDLHALVDDAHGAVLERLSVQLVRSPRELAEVRLGMLCALSLRATFFDGMLRRARAMTRAVGAS